MRNRSTWKLWILPSLLLVTAIFHVRSVTRRNLVNRAATQLAADGARLERVIEAGRFKQLETVFEQARQESRLSIVWVQLRGEDGTVEAGVGPKAEPAFPVDFVRSRSKNGQPVFKVLERYKVEILVEAFSTHVGIIEIAARLDRMKAGIPPRPPRFVRQPAVRFARFAPASVPTIFLSPALSNDADAKKSTGRVVNTTI